MRWKMKLKQMFVISVVLLLCSITLPLSAQEGGKSPVRLEAQELVEQGMALSDGSKEEEAFYLQAHDVDPSYYRPLFDLGLVYTDRRAYPIALTYFERFSQFEPESAAGLYQLAATHDNLRNDGTALNYYTRYLSAATAQTDFTVEEKEFIGSATNAIRRLMISNSAPTSTTSDTGTVPTSKTVSRSEQIATIMNTHNQAGVDEIVDILARPRMRGVNFRLESAPVYGNSEIRFNKGKSDILSDSYDALDKIAGALMHDKLSKHVFVIHGHASTEGDEDVNKVLSEKRALAVKKYLSDEYAISPERLDTYAWGEANPLVLPELAERDRTHNRRVEFENSGLIVHTKSGVTRTPQ